MLNGGHMYNDTSVLAQQGCPVPTLFLDVHKIMSTSRRGRHVQVLPPEQATPTGVEDAYGFEGVVIPLHDHEDCEPLASIDQQFRHHVLLRLPSPIRPFNVLFGDLT